jgi:hypothetical protein
MLLGPQRRIQYCRYPRIGSARRHPLISDQLRLDNKARGRIHRFDVVADGGHRSLGQRYQPHRRDPHGPSGRRGPLQAPAQHAGPEIEGALMGQQPAMTDVERLVVDHQSQHLAIGDVNNRLAQVRVTEAGLCIWQRAEFVAAVQIRARQPVRLALIEVAAPAHMAVGKGEQ